MVVSVVVQKLLVLLNLESHLMQSFVSSQEEDGVLILYCSEQELGC